SQHKNYTTSEVKKARQRLYEAVARNEHHISPHAHGRTSASSVPSDVQSPNPPTPIEWRQLERDFAEIAHRHFEADSSRDSGADQPSRWRVRTALLESNEVAINRYNAIATLAGQCLKRIPNIERDHPKIWSANDRDTWLNALARFRGSRPRGETTTS